MREEFRQGADLDLDEILRPSEEFRASLDVELPNILRRKSSRQAAELPVDLSPKSTSSLLLGRFVTQITHIFRRN
jgi:hypothetical protein